MRDIQGNIRGKCLEVECICKDFTSVSGMPMCAYCGHIPVKHLLIQELCTPSISAGPESQLQLNGSTHQPIPPPLYSAEDVELLPSFPDWLMPYLRGTEVNLKEIKRQRTALIDQIIEHLDQQTLIMDRNCMKQAWSYKRLERALLNKFPNIIREESHRKNKRKNDLPLLMSLLTDRRRQRRKRFPPLQPERFSLTDEAYHFLESTSYESDTKAALELHLSDREKPS